MTACHDSDIEAHCVARLLRWAADMTKTGDKMANLYKKALIQRDATGKRTPYKTEKWWGRYRNAHGVTKRVPLSENKQTAQRMLGEILSRVELEKSGLVQPMEIEAKKPIELHLAEFERHLKAKNDGPVHIRQSLMKIRAAIQFGRWKRILDITAPSVESFLADLRNRRGLAIETSNHYLRVIRTFVHWLVATNQLVKSPLGIIKILNVKLDQRHYRRALSQDEFHRLVEAAEQGPPSEGLTGTDRAMLYLLAAWTGFRRGELGSLTLRSFDLVSNPMIVRIQAAYSKRRREDSQVLHPDLVEYFHKWATKRFGGPVLNLQPSRTSELLFPIVARTGGIDRNTAKMIRSDLAAARRKWVAEAENNDERILREESDFLC